MLSWSWSALFSQQLSSAPLLTLHGEDIQSKTWWVSRTLLYLQLYICDFVSPIAEHLDVMHFVYFKKLTVLMARLGCSLSSLCAFWLQVWHVAWLDIRGCSIRFRLSLLVQQLVYCHRNSHYIQGHPKQTIRADRCSMWQTSCCVVCIEQQCRCLMTMHFHTYSYNTWKLVFTYCVEIFLDYGLSKMTESCITNLLFSLN